MRRNLVLAVLVFSMLVPLCADTVVAVAGVENAGGDPRHDYLAGIVEGLLLFDLSRSPGIILVNRSRIEDVLDEQRLVLSGLSSTGGKAAEIGRLAGADALIHGSYVFIGSEALFTLSITDVESGTSRAVNERGSTENAIHRLAEKALAAINGARVSFADPDSDRSILSMQDEKPGEIALYSNLIDAEIRLDGEFAGYTTGDLRIPYIIGGVSPGLHRVETDLGADFGVVSLPEVIFRNWSSEVRVTSGNRSILRADERHFNSILYDLQRLFRLSETLYNDRESKLGFSEDVSFVDRKGTAVSASIAGEVLFEEGVGVIDLKYSYAGETRSFRVSSADETGEIDTRIGLTRLRVQIETRYSNACSVTVDLGRTDIYQGLHREEGKRN
jgi:Curli production assembly/transport component CsgG